MRKITKRIAVSAIALSMMAVQPVMPANILLGEAGIPSVEMTVYAASSESSVKSRLDKIANGSLKYNNSTMLKVGSRFSGTRSSEQCKGYAKNVFYLLFKVTPGITSSKPNNHKLNSYSGMKQIATDGSLTAKDAKKMFANARPGDFVQMRRRSTGGSHSAIVYSANSNGVTFLEANTDGRNTIFKNTYSWKKLEEKNIKMTVYTASNYKLK